MTTTGDSDDGPDDGAAGRPIRRAELERRDAVYRAAMTLIAERGIDATRVADIGRRVGMSPGHVLYYFGTKERLLVDTLRWSEGDLGDQRRAAMRHGRPGWPKLRRFTDIYLPDGTSDPRWRLWIETVAKPRGRRGCPARGARAELARRLRPGRHRGYAGGDSGRSTSRTSRPVHRHARRSVDRSRRRRPRSRRCPVARRTGCSDRTRRDRGAPQDAGASPPTAAGRGPARLELDDRVLRVRDPRVVHAQQLLDERRPDPLQVAQRQVALVELSVGDALLDDPRDHRPDGRLVARRQRADGRLDPVGEHDQRRLAGLRLGADVPEPALVDGRRGLGARRSWRARRTARPPAPSPGHRSSS